MRSWPRAFGIAAIMAAISVGVDAQPTEPPPSTLTECDIVDPATQPDEEVAVSVDEQAQSDADQCFNLATWVPSTPPSTPCLCDPYNVCQSTLLSEQCSSYSPTGVPVTHSYWVRITCPELQFGWQQVTTTTTTYAAFCTISYKCNGSTVVCSATGTKYIKRRKVKYGPPICPAVPD